MCVINTFIAEGRPELTRVITKHLVLAANADVNKLGEMSKDVNTRYRQSIS